VVLTGLPASLFRIVGSGSAIFLLFFRGYVGFLLPPASVPHQ
jgi:hypothetical protein